MPPWRRATLSCVDTPGSVAWVVFALVAANVLAYVNAFSSPIIISDAWYFLDVFISKAIKGSLHLADFFVQRGGFDHAQPLRKLLLLFNLYCFDLDFRIEAIIGACCAVGSLLLLRCLVFRHEPGKPGLRTWIWAAICVTLISLNSTGVWTWPLVASSFTTYLFLFILLLSLSRQLETGGLVLLAISALTLDMVADDSALLVNIACILALSFVAWRVREQRRRASFGAGCLIVCLIIARIAYATIYTPPHGGAMPLDERMPRLLSAFVDGGWWQWILVPLGSSIAYINPLKKFAGDGAHVIQGILGVLLLFCHGWFWWHAFRNRPNTTTFSAIVMMLLFYALTAGIIFARIPTYGNEYLNQGRYILVYSFGNVALLLMCASCKWATDRSRFKTRTMAAAAMIMLIGWQIPLTVDAWRTGPYIAAYHQKQARKIWYLADHLHKAPGKCTPGLTVCTYPPKKRARLIEMLKKNHLNVFSPKFQRANQIYPQGYFDKK